MGAPASQTEIGVWVQAPGALAETRGITSGKNFEIVQVYAKFCNLVHVGVLKHFNNWNGVPPRNDHWFYNIFYNIF